MVKKLLELSGHETDQDIAKASREDVVPYRAPRCHRHGKADVADRLSAARRRKGIERKLRLTTRPRKGSFFVGEQGKHFDALL
jgi:hypothetical protein